MQKADPPPVYVATPQRLDQNTSGLFVMATKKPFAAYFAQLLRGKTADVLVDADDRSDRSDTEGEDEGGGGRVGQGRE